MDRVRLGVIGAGNIADMNVAGYLKHPECDVVAVCDVDTAVAKEAAERWGCRGCTPTSTRSWAMPRSTRWRS